MAQTLDTILYYFLVNVYAFEPQSQNFKLLVDNIALNGVKNAILYNYALGDDHVCVHNDNLTNFRINFKNYIYPHTENNEINYNLTNGVQEKICFLFGYHDSTKREIMFPRL